MPTFLIMREVPQLLPVKEVVVTLSAEEVREILSAYDAVGYFPKSTTLQEIHNKLKTL